MSFQVSETDASLHRNILWSRFALSMRCSRVMAVVHIAGGRRTKLGEVGKDEASTEDVQQETLAAILHCRDTASNSEHIRAEANVAWVLLLVSLVTLLPMLMLGLLLGGHMLNLSTQEEDPDGSDTNSLEW